MEDVNENYASLEMMFELMRLLKNLDWVDYSDIYEICVPFLQLELFFGPSKMIDLVNLTAITGFYHE